MAIASWIACCFLLCYCWLMGEKIRALEIAVERLTDRIEVNGDGGGNG